MIYFLYRGRRKCAWLIYREEKLKRILRKKSNQSFLRNYGYEVFSVEAVLKRLSERAAQYLDGTMPYPHELGIILGYPLEDVEGFIRCEKLSPFGILEGLRRCGGSTQEICSVSEG